VIIPEYTRNPYFNVYDEINKPPETLYMAVGFNNKTVTQELVQAQEMHRGPDQSIIDFAH
jgi:hypothetical protein